MLHKDLKSIMLMLIMAVFTLTSAQAQEQELQKEYSDEEQQSVESYDRIRIDRYLNVEIWTDHDDDEYYEGDRVKFYYRVSRDAFVAIYSVDSRGRVNLLFPSLPGQDNYVTGGVTHSLPGRNDDYDLVVNGPNGVENVQIIASREPFPIPDWYDNSGLFCDWDDRHDYMDWVNAQYFVKYEGQRFAFDRTALYVYEWEPYYFRPVYRPYYPNWTVCGNVYVDYWPGSSIYIDGIFWGVTPCYIPRIYVGWHTFTVYDRYNYCWEYDVHVTRYNTVVLDHTVIFTQPQVRSKFKTVRFAGYQEPTKAGYGDFREKVKVIQKSGAWKTETVGKIIADSKEVEKNKTVYTGERKFVKGSSKIVTTERGIETAGAPVEPGMERGRAKKHGPGDAFEKRGAGESDQNTDSRGSIFKRRDSNNQTESGSKAGTGVERRESMKKRHSPASTGGNDDGNSGSYKRTTPTPSRKESPANNNARSVDQKKETPSQEKSKPHSDGKKPDGAAAVKSSDNQKSNEAVKSENKSTKENSPSKSASGKPKGKPGGRK